MYLLFLNANTIANIYYKLIISGKYYIGLALVLADVLTGKMRTYK